jgi:uncharacterized caspase-like protein
VALLLVPSAAAGVRVMRTANQGAPVAPSESAALFVGIQKFSYDKTLTEVKYAVDDAINLAYALALDPATRLIPPDRVVLALSGQPQKDESKRQLEALRAAGVVPKNAGQADVITLLEQQARAVGPNGILVVSFATHGISEEGTQYLLTATSVLQHRETTLTETKVRDIVNRAGVPRSLILLDACRQRLTTDRRAGDSDPRSAAALLRVMGDVSGQVVLSAAAAGEYAYDDDERGNGVFTAAVIDGLRCQAPADPRGFVTVDTLSVFVEERVLSWVRKHRDRNVRRATQLSCEGRTRTMPLARCSVTGGE